MTHKNRDIAAAAFVLGRYSRRIDEKMAEGANQAGVHLPWAAYPSPNIDPACHQQSVDAVREGLQMMLAAAQARPQDGEEPMVREIARQAGFPLD